MIIQDNNTNSNKNKQNIKLADIRHEVSQNVLVYTNKTIL